MELQFFGTSGAVPAAGDGNVSFLLSVEKTTVLVDLSGNPVANLLRAGVDPLGLDAVVLTHAHPDHLYALPSLVQSLWLMKRKRPLHFFTNPQTADKARALLDLFGLLHTPGGCELLWTMDGDTPIEVSTSTRITLFPVRHSIPTSGVRVESLGAAAAYSADTAPCPELLGAARGCRALIHEASGPETRKEELNEAGHTAGAQAGEIAAAAEVATLFLCHFDRSGGFRPEQMMAEARRHFAGLLVIPEPFTPYRI
jgi:ribonuclease Z